MLYFHVIMQAEPLQDFKPLGGLQGRERSLLLIGRIPQPRMQVWQGMSQQKEAQGLPSSVLMSGTVDSLTKET